jgi:hypothetical protein
MNTQHTPGAWDYDYYEGHIALSSPKHPDDYFARVEFSPCVDTSPWDGDSPMTEDVANTKLIAAAPELLAACIELVEHIEALPDDTEKCRILRLALNNRAGEKVKEAINKATT